MTDELLVKYLAGNTSETEDAHVQQWISEDSANEKYFSRFKLLWDASAGMAINSAVDTDEAWQRFKKRTELSPRQIPIFPKHGWLKVAASLLVLVCAAGLFYFIKGQNNVQPVVALNPIPAEKEVAPKQTLIPVNETGKEQRTIEKHPALAVTHKDIKKAGKAIKKTLPDKSGSAKEYVCNNTPCPIEICIIQSVKCKSDHPVPVATCSVLEPDQSGQLKYKAFDKISKNCKATIDEIRITQVSTGKTIVLNANSKPATAQEFFNYITGEKKGDILAGVFHSDCNDQSDDCGLKFDNNYGNLFLQ